MISNEDFKIWIWKDRNFNLIYRKKKKNIWIIQIINKRQHLTSLDAQKICTARKRKKNKVMNQMSDRIMSTFNRIILLCVTWIKILGSLNSDPTGIHWSSMFSQMGSTSLWSRILILILLNTISQKKSNLILHRPKFLQLSYAI